MVFSFSILCLAEKFLRVPNLTYVYRQRADSVSHKQFDEPSEYFHKWLRVMNDGLNEFAQFMDTVKFFEENLDYRYAVLNFYFKELSSVLEPFYGSFHEFALNEFVKKEFHPDNAEFAALLFNKLNVQRLLLKK